METLHIDGHQVILSIYDELIQYDWGANARWSDDKLIAKSPFREDNSPSFYVNFTGQYAGRWGDSGAIDTRTSFGDLPKLIAQLQGISYQEAKEYLIESYGVSGQRKTDKDLKIPTIRLKEERKKSSIDESRLLEASNEYLLGRGITESVQTKYRIGSMRNTPEFVALSWTDDTDGEIVCIKNRAIEGRDMYYERGSLGVNNLVYGLYEAKDSDYLVICEGEVDVLSFAEAGIHAVALGTANISHRQKQKILYQGFKHIYMAGDNDQAGLNLNRKMYLEFKGRAMLHLVDYGEYNDANDALIGSGTDFLLDVITNAKEIKSKLLTNR